MTEPIAYSVTTTLPNEGMAQDYVDWLRDGHVQAVIAGGAKSAVVVRLEPDAAGRPRVESRYEFLSREAFDRYVKEVAPGLRADGVARFPAERGVTMERRVGVVEGRWGG